MSEAEAIQRAISRAHPPIVMSLEDVADVLGYSVNYVRNELQHQPGFPVKLDRFKDEPRWSRDSVLKWKPAAAKRAKAEKRKKFRIKYGTGDTYLYRHFDANGVLLYVGISGSVTTRLKQHRESQWAGMIKTVTVDKFTTREEALGAELEAIRSESPRFNKAGIKK